jgi:hypothetical protein
MDFFKTGPVSAAPGASATTAGEEAVHLHHAHGTGDLQLFLPALWAGLVLNIEVCLGNSRKIASTLLAYAFII